MNAQNPSTRTPSLGGNAYRGGYSPRGFKNGEVGNGAQSGRSAEGTVLEVRLTRRMMVMPVVGSSAAGVSRAELHQERGATRGHEPHGDIGTKDERGQQYNGQHIGSPSVTEPSLHDLRTSPCQSERHCSSRHGGSAVPQIDMTQSARQVPAASRPRPLPLTQMHGHNNIVITMKALPLMVRRIGNSVKP